MSRADIHRRMRSAIGKGTIYGLGKGGRQPLALLPHDANRMCDCSGAIAWACGIDRYQPRSPLYRKFNGGWVSTDSIAYDARRPKAESGWFTIVPSPEPGDVVVYPDYSVNGKPHQGHTAIVSAFDPVTWWDGLMVIDCSSTNYKAHGDAIWERKGDFFGRHSAIFCRFDPPEAHASAEIPT